MDTILVSPVFKPEISFSTKNLVSEEKSTIVHFKKIYGTRIRIWPTTFLVQEDGSRKKLLHAFNISEYPQWKYAPAGHEFTLVFEGLDNHCLIFALFEDIPEPGGFHVENIERNKTDVYWLET